MKFKICAEWRNAIAGRKTETDQMGRDDRSKDARLLVVLGLLSAAIGAHQIALMQVLGWMHWHHFAYLIVAVALLGYGMAGTVLSLARDRLNRSWRRWLPWLLLGAAASMPAGVRLAQTGVFAVDLPLVFHDPRNAWRLAALCLLLLPPFFCAGLVTGMVLTSQARDAGRTYAASLAGAGLGGLLGLALVSSVNPPRLPAVIALVVLGAVGPLWRELDRTARLAAMLACLLVGAFAWAPGDLRSSQFKSLRRTLDLPDARIIASQPSLHGWIQVVDAPALRPAPAVGFQFQGEIPRQRAVFVNGLSQGSLLTADSVGSPFWLEHTTDAAAFLVNAPRDVLLLENGPGGWAALAARHGARRVLVVESNRALIRLLTAGNPSLAPEWRLPSVTTVAAGGRAFLRRIAERFDLIRFPTVGALGGTAGLNAASEQFLLTREAFVEAWRRLAPEGVIAVTVWMDFPERNPLRLIATLAEALESEGAIPRAHIAAVRGWATVTLLARREPWTAGLVAALRKFSAERGFDPLLLPGLEPAERENHHGWQNPEFFRLVDHLVDGPREPIYRTHEFHVRPSRDDRPYFSQFLRWTRWDRLSAIFGARTAPFFELGSLVVGLTFLVLGVLAVTGIVLPLLRTGWRVPGRAAVLLYFGGLGAGFMAVEIGLILRAQAWLGSPVLAVAVVITALLFASGLGSMWSERAKIDGRTRRRIVAVIAAGILLLPVLLAMFDPLARAWPPVAQACALIAIVAGVGFPMGMAFPLGLRHLEVTAPSHLPWAWAINGCISVATPAGAMLLAMTAGFTAVFAFAVLAYGIAFVGLACRFFPD